MSTIKDNILFLFLFFLLTCLFFWKVFTLQMTFLTGDYLQQFFPWMNFYAMSIKNFNIPLWTKHIQSGFPLFAEGQSGMLYPLNVIFFYLLPFKVAYNYSFLFHFILAGFFMYLYVKKMGSKKSGAFLAAIILCFGSVYAGSFININALKTLCFFPAILFIFENYFSYYKNIKLFLLIGIIWGIQLLCGSIQMAFYSIALCLSYFFLKAYLFNRSTLRYIFIYSLLAGIIALLIAMPQLYATLELTKYSIRSHQTIEFALWNSFSPLALTGLIFPILGSLFIRNNVVYISLIGFFFFIAAVLNFKRDKIIKFVVLLLLLVFFFALGKYNPFCILFFKLTRIYSFRGPSKLIYFIVFFSAILVAKGFTYYFDSNLSNLSEKVYKIFSVALLIVAVVFLSLKLLVTKYSQELLVILKRFVAYNIYGKSFHRYSLPFYLEKVESKFMVVKEKLLLSFPFTFYGICIIFCIFIFTFVLTRYGKKNFLKFMSIGFIVIDLFIYSNFFEGPRTSLSTFEAINIKQPKIYNILKKDKSIYRICPFSIEKKLPVWASFNANMIYDLDSIGLYSPLSNEDYFSKVSILGVVDDSLGIISPGEAAVGANKKLLEHLNVKYIASSKRLKDDDFEEMLEEEGIYLYKLSNFKPRFIFSASLDDINKKQGSVDIIEYNSGTAKILINAYSDGYLIFSEKFYPGWKVFIDGAKEEIIKVNDILMGTKINKGRHSVLFSFKPDYFYPMLFFSLAILFLISIIICYDRKKI
ncbi:MAG: YfhO family protein [Patescibacteria group bacterium]